LLTSNKLNRLPKRPLDMARNEADGLLDIQWHAEPSAKGVSLFDWNDVSGNLRADVEGIRTRVNENMEDYNERSS
jgi:hypothetical protein